MSLGTTIEWTDATWNPVRGCTKVSAGCKNCYAERFAERFRGVPGHPFEYGFDLRIVPEKLADPLKWKEPRLVFVNSMSDLFHEGVSDAYIEQVAEVMMKADWHTYQILTKRGTRLESLLKTKLKKAALQKHIWWGVSVENKRDGIPRIKQLQSSPAKVRFLSVEPLIEDVGRLNLRGIAWVIVGGESGPRSRPIEASWVRSIKQQCEFAGVAFFFKQWGGVQKKSAGRDLDGETYSEFPARISNPIPDERERHALIDSFRMKADLVELTV